MKNYAILNSIFLIIGLGCFPAAAEDMQKIAGVNELCVYYKKQIENNTLVLFIVQDTSVMQTVTYTYDEEEPPKYNDLYIADINFDGFSDILFCIGQYGAQGAAYYSCFMWNTEKKCFTLCRDIESVPNLKINAGDKYICGFSRENAVVYVYDIYTWKNGNLKLRYLVYETQDAFTLNRWGDKTAYDVPVLKKAVYKVEEFCNGSRIRQNIVPELSAELENCIHSAGMHAYRTGI